MLTPTNKTTRIFKLAKEGRAFRPEEVAQRICDSELKRLNDEAMLWKLGGGLIGLLAGSLDGFNAGDIMTGLVISNIANQGHQVFSKEQKVLLQKCKAYWAVGEGSPLDIMKNIGAATTRVVMYTKDSQEPKIYNLHKGIRGQYLMPLDFAHEIAPGFTTMENKKVMARTFESNELEKIAYHLYPDQSKVKKVESLMRVSREEINNKKNFEDEPINGSQVLLIEAGGVKNQAFAFDIPVHSAF